LQTFVDPDGSYSLLLLIMMLQPIINLYIRQKRYIHQVLWTWYM